MNSIYLAQLSQNFLLVKDFHGNNSFIKCHYNESGSEVPHTNILLLLLVFSPKAGFGRNQSPVRQPV